MNETEDGDTDEATHALQEGPQKEDINKSE